MGNHRGVPHIAAQEKQVIGIHPLEKVQHLFPILFHHGPENYAAAVFQDSLFVVRRHLSPSLWHNAADLEASGFPFLSFRNAIPDYV
jgi:hypothetical protein